jgi:glyoxylase-like metal-dependent hydrolase (beta-lactamase superfamily II)
MPAEEIASGSHAIQCEHVCTYVLEDTPTGQTTLIDTAFDDDGPELVEILREEFDGVDRIIITH